MCIPIALRAKCPAWFDFETDIVKLCTSRRNRRTNPPMQNISIAWIRSLSTFANQKVSRVISANAKWTLIFPRHFQTIPKPTKELRFVAKRYPNWLIDWRHTCREIYGKPRMSALFESTYTEMCTKNEKKTLNDTIQSDVIINGNYRESYIGI